MALTVISRLTRREFDFLMRGPIHAFQTHMQQAFQMRVNNCLLGKSKLTIALPQLSNLEINHHCHEIAREPMGNYELSSIFSTSGYNLSMMDHSFGLLQAFKLYHDYLTH